MSKLKFRLAKLSDLDQIVKLESKCFEENQVIRQGYRRLIHAKTATFIVAEVAGYVIAFIIITFRKNSKKARLFMLCVETTFRNYGIAGMLCDLGENFAIKRKCNAIVLEVRSDDTKAIQYYKARKYKNFGIYKKYFENKVSALRMKKDLP